MLPACLPSLLLQLEEWVEATGAAPGNWIALRGYQQQAVIRHVPAAQTAEKTQARPQQQPRQPMPRHVSRQVPLQQLLGQHALARPPAQWLMPSPPVAATRPPSAVPEPQPKLPQAAWTALEVSLPAVLPLSFAAAAESAAAAAAAEETATKAAAQQEQVGAEAATAIQRGLAAVRRISELAQATLREVGAAQAAMSGGGELEAEAAGAAAGGGSAGALSSGESLPRTEPASPVAGAARLGVQAQAAAARLQQEEALEPGAKRQRLESASSCWMEQAAAAALP